MSRRWIWWMLALLVVLVVMAAALWQATAKCLVMVGQFFKRPDGNIVRLEGLTY